MQSYCGYQERRSDIRPLCLSNGKYSKEIKGSQVNTNYQILMHYTRMIKSVLAGTFGVTAPDAVTVVSVELT